MMLGWRPGTRPGNAYQPFAYGISIQLGIPDPAFMQRCDLPPREKERTNFPFEPE
ncbi:hypothetical protein EDC04DRAFT_2683791 [Pisolithus marmoratus]|nr:hypothetical protein EDC04DRAFT_2683791 [Pisolithus marmoratus]